MSVVELQELEEVKLLVTKGTATGVLTYAEIAFALAEVDLDESDIEDLHGFLEKSELGSSKESVPRFPPRQGTPPPTPKAGGPKPRAPSVLRRTWTPTSL